MSSNSSYNALAGKHARSSDCEEGGLAPKGTRKEGGEWPNSHRRSLRRPTLSGR